MEVPKFLIADSSSLQDEIFVLHTEYPRFLLNVSNDEILWLEEFGKEDQDELEKITEELILTVTIRANLLVLSEYGLNLRMSPD